MAIQFQGIKCFLPWESMIGLLLTALTTLLACIITDLDLDQFEAEMQLLIAAALLLLLGPMWIIALSMHLCALSKKRVLSSTETALLVAFIVLGAQRVLDLYCVEYVIWPAIVGLAVGAVEVDTSLVPTEEPRKEYYCGCGSRLVV